MAVSQHDKSKRPDAALKRDLASIMAVVDAGIVTIDPGGRVRSMNAAAVRILGEPIDDISTFLGPLWVQGSPDGRGADPDTVELQYLRRPERWLEVVSGSRAGDSSPGVVVIRDVTEARRDNGLREAFLSMLSHELRTPVTSIFAAASLLRSRSNTLDAEQRVGLVGDIAEEADRLLRLVEDLLVLAHSDDGIDLVQVPCLVQHVVPPIVERERKRWPAISIELRVESDLPVVTGDETSVQQIVRNLVSNAAKYGLGKPVTVELVREEAGRGVVVRVLDSGPGVNPEEGEALFRPFYRSARTARASSSAGIGLYVCRQLVEAMGGYIWARQRPYGGSEFGFLLPEYDLEDERGEALEARPYPTPARAAAALIQAR